jgi:DNA-binding transcriptional MerR regulator
VTQQGDARMTISQLAAATGISVHTLRYYEKVKLIPLVERNAAGHRRFQKDHVRWLGLLERLRTSGMSIARMREYVRLVQRGDASVARRLALLVQHESEITERIRELKQCLRIVRAKIGLYNGSQPDPQVVWDLVAAAQRRVRNGSPRGIRNIH